MSLFSAASAIASQITAQPPKFGRNYLLSVETDQNTLSFLNGAETFGTTISIALPFTIEFDITRNSLTSANVCQIRCYNLSQTNRNQIRYNAYDVGGTPRQVLLKAGYGNVLNTIFQGNITQASSYRQGVDYITEIECFDGGFSYVNSNVSIPFPAGTPWIVVIKTLMAQLKGVTVGKVGNYIGVTGRGNTYSGNPAQLLFEITGGGFFIDNNVAYALGSNEYIPDLGTTLTINDSSGIIGTPTIEGTVARFEMLFEPSLDVGRLVSISSSVNPAFPSVLPAGVMPPSGIASTFNTTYKITSVKHRGMISGTVCGSCTTLGEFYYSKTLIPAVS